MQVEKDGDYICFRFKRSTFYTFVCLLVLWGAWHERVNIADFVDGVKAGFRGGEDARGAWVPEGVTVPLSA